MMKLALVSVVLAAACGAPSPPAVTIAMTATAALPAYGTTPFPTDALRDGDHLAAIPGLDALSVLHTDEVTAQVAALDGFGMRPLVELFVTGAGGLDAASLPATTRDASAPAVVVDVDASSPERGRVIAMEWRYDAARAVIAGSPASGEVLREGTRYAAYVTTSLRTADGDALGRAPALDDLLAAAPARWQSTADALRTLPDDVAGVAVFTTQHATAPLVAAHVAYASAPAPVLTFPDPRVIFAGTAALDRLLGHATRATDGPRAGLERWGNDNPTGIAHDHVGVVGTGQITIALFPAMTELQTIPITVILPAAPPPATGYPVVIYGHGLGASRDQLLSFAEPLTAQGYALVGIDMVDHGSRFDPTDDANNFAAQIPGFTGDAAMPDGFGDRTGLVSTFDFFRGFLDVAAVRDEIRQSALDLSRVAQLVRSPDLDLSALAPGAKLDARHVAYLGESFGTVVGTLFAAIEPAIDLYVLDVPGGGILDRLLPSSADIGSLALPVIDTIYHPHGALDRWNPLIGLMQAVIDGGDPLSYAPHVLRDRFAGIGPRSVVCIEVVGDQVLSNVGTDALARELDLDVLGPALAQPPGLAQVASPAAGNRADAGTMQTAVLVQYAPATHGANWSSEHGTLEYLPGFPFPGDDPFPKLPAPITITEPLYATLAQVTEILATHQAGEPPLVRSTAAPRADFDDDGFVDRDDRYPLDPTRH